MECGSPDADIQMTFIRLQFQFVDTKCSSETDLQVEVEKPDVLKVFELLGEIAKCPTVILVGPNDGGSGRLRLLHIYQGRIMYIVPGEALVGSLLRVPEGTVHRVEEIPSDQLPEKYDPRTELMISCMHHAGLDGLTALGRPFLLKIHAGDEMLDTVSRMKEKLEMQDEEFKKWRVALTKGDRGYTVEATVRGEGQGRTTPPTAIGSFYGLKTPPKPRSSPASGDS